MKLSDEKFKLIVISNRLPFVLKRLPNNGGLKRMASPGGLVTAVAPVVAETNGYWVGWPGIFLQDGEKIPEADPEDRSPTSGLHASQITPVNLQRNHYDLYYNGCCNSTFWPLCHSMPERGSFKDEYWDAYKSVNASFASYALNVLRESTTEDPNTLHIVWVQDYHLFLASKIIKEKAKSEKIPCLISFFLHVPFPSYDMFKVLPWEQDVLNGMLGADLVGFHIEDYVHNFINCCERSLEYRVDRAEKLVETKKGDIVHVKAMPISIPFKRFEQMAKANAKKPFGTTQAPHVKIILGVDRMDYTKGIPNKIRGFDHLLEKHPEFHEKVTLVQIAVPTRQEVDEYQVLKDEIDKLVGYTNGRFATLHWTPIQYIFNSLPHVELAACYRDADIMLVTPLRDGMNLVAKEFVACQVNNPGTLILSPFTGAALQMEEALFVNSYEIEDISRILSQALQMEDEEKQERMSRLREREKANDVNRWMKQFIEHAEDVVKARATDAKHSFEEEELVLDDQ